MPYSRVYEFLSRRWWLAVFFLGWTALAALAVAWLVGDATNAGNRVIRVGPEEAKAWGIIDQIHVNRAASDALTT